MAFLLDTGIVLRLVDTQDPQHSLVLAAVRMLGNRQEALYITTQNIAEFCSVATRPISNNGLGLAPADAIKLLDRDIEPICATLVERDTLASELKRLVAQYSVVGKQVHDARLVAMMLIWQIENVLTLNERNFRRFEPEGIAIVSPGSLIAPGP
ncbi:MAG: PIN domain-containing protein [Pirellulales bacterium]